MRRGRAPNRSARGHMCDVLVNGGVCRRPAESSVRVPATGCGRILAYVNEGGERKRLDLDVVLLFVHESVQVLVDRVLWVGESHGREIRGRSCLERRRDGDVVQKVRQGTARRHMKLCISVVLS